MSKIVLGEEQLQALDLIKKFVKSNEKVFTLIGYAGTGKTTLIKEIIDYFEDNYIRYAIAAPTHKAKSVIKYNIDRDVSTVHSLLRLSPQIEIMDLDLRNLQFITSSTKTTLDGIPTKGIVLCDEASMINDFLYKLLLEKCNLLKTKIIFVGDMAQLKPVNEDYYSLVFSNPNKFELTKIYRQSIDSAFSDVLPILREQVIPRFKTSIRSNGSIICTPTAKELFEYGVPAFKKAIKDRNIFETKLLAYTNKRTQALNYKMREILFGKESEYEENEFLTAYENFTYGLTTYWNSMDYVVAAPPIKVSRNIPHFMELPGYMLELYDYGTDTTDEIFILSRNIDYKYYHSLAHLIETTRTEAVIRKQQKDRGSSLMWQKYYSIINSFASPIDLYFDGRLVKKKTFDYGYGCTVHKSQGSSIDSVFIDMKDIGVCRNEMELRQLQYVSVSRSKQNAYLLQ